MEAILVAGTDGRYSVNRNGDVFGPRGKLKPTLMKIGYYSVALSLGQRVVKRAYVHRLVAEAFMGPIPSGRIVDHINHDKTDNRLENLRVVSRKENGRAWVGTGARQNPRGDAVRSTHCKRGHPYAVTSKGNVYCPACRKLKQEGKITRPTGEWREIDIEGYFVSSEGQVWSEKHSTLLKPGVNGPGYHYVHIGGQVQALHRLVATAFLGSISSDIVVDHIDGDKLNNRSGNLRLVTRNENTRHYHSKRVEEGGDQIAQAEIKWLVLNTDIPQKAIADHYGVVQSTVAAIKSGLLHNRVKPIRPTSTNRDQYVHSKTAICPVCEQEYEQKRVDKKYCSLQCKGKARYRR